MPQSYQQFSDVLNKRLRDTFERIDALSLKSIVEDAGSTKLAESFIDRNAKFSIPKLRWDEETVRKDTVPKPIDRSVEYRDPSAPKVDWDVYTVSVPFDGDISLLSVVSLEGDRLPDTASITESRVVFQIQGVAPLDGATARRNYDLAKQITQKFLETIEKSYALYVERISTEIPARIDARRALLERNDKDLKAFGIRSES